MVNYIWAIMAIGGIIYAMFTGTMDQVNKAIFKSADDAVVLAISLISVMVFWLGITKIAEAAGLLNALVRLAKPFISRLFPDIPKDHPAMGYILSNLTANFFGLGNAATPMGIKAMEEMKKLSNSPKASRSMITFLAVNTSSLTLIPTTVLAVRMKYESNSPTEIVSATLLASILSFIGAILIDRLFYEIRRRKERRI
ncbi:nucleoside recognition domain-containing protein [Terribacillus halophilus]|jgi:spore maturation protein A|uniref:nucleoside recognition domain-containing protein n=1 Tax=Terribacillus halophilus TaxID=361279 RepID=UPI000985E0B5|nr:nucleoside recognition domain-containing protein [Terribacillus halophilus]